MKFLKSKLTIKFDQDKRLKKQFSDRVSNQFRILVEKNLKLPVQLFHL